MARIHRKTIQKKSSETNKQTNTNKKDLHNPDNHNSVITYPEPEILECEVKWAFREASLRTKLVEVMEFQLSYFKS